MEQHRGLLGGIAAIVLTGVALGVGYNALALAGKPARGLAWIKQEIVVPELPSVTTSPAPIVQQPPADPVSDDADAAEARTPPAPPAEDDDERATSTPVEQPTEAEAPYVPDTGGPFRVGLDNAKRFFDARGARFIDARDPPEFAEGHIAGAINMPHEQVITDSDRLSAVDSGGRAIITYCGGGSCEVSISLAEALVHQAGKSKVLVFIDGYPAWAEAGYPIERGAR